LLDDDGGNPFMVYAHWPDIPEKNNMDQRIAN